MGGPDLAPPAEWPPEVSSCYTPVRVVGTGGFASVWMAKKKVSSDGTAPGKTEEHVAIKVMQDDGYAKREIAVLSELSKKYAHPHIVRLIQDHHTDKTDVGASSNTKGGGANCVVLSLARGPTLNYIINKHGALGLIVSQVIARQLIDAVAFLHGHAVIHRDIQPCNIIVSGAQMNDDLWWSDKEDVDGKVVKMAKQVNITLVDFGFARALSPKDIKKDVGLKKNMEEGEMSVSPERNRGCGVPPKKIQISEDDKEYNGARVNQALQDTLTMKEAKDRQGGRGRSRTRELDGSVSHTRVRDLSALGTRNYAAPEILTGIRSFADFMNASFHSLSGSHRGEMKRHTQKKALAECVSDYGMVADAFSVGATIRHMVTGVHPSVNVDDFIASRNHPMKKLLKKLKKSIKKSDKRAKVYRTSEDIPDEVNDLIQELTHYDARRRATVRSATNHPWIDLPGNASSSNPTRKELEHGGPIVYLECGEENFAAQ